MPVKLTPFQAHVLTQLQKFGPCGPAHLSGFVWPNNPRISRGNAPGTGLVRPMLAILAQLRKRDLVRWFSDNGEPGKWEIAFAGTTALRERSQQQFHDAVSGTDYNDGGSSRG